MSLWSKKEAARGILFPPLTSPSGKYTNASSSLLPEKGGKVKVFLLRLLESMYSVKEQGVSEWSSANRLMQGLLINF